MSLFADILEALGLASISQPRPPQPIGGAWLGIDREDMPGVGTQSGPDLTWMQLLQENSNLRFCGAYLEGGPTTFPTNTAGLPNNTKPIVGSGKTNDTPFTTASTATSRAWIPNITALRAQGWGTVFFYVGYSVSGGQPILPYSNAAPSQYAALGQLHAQHAKLIMAAISPLLDGAVVYLDNEDGDDQLGQLKSKTGIMQYYKAFFTELQQPGPGAKVPAMRPGLYARPSVMKPFLGARADLYWWQVAYPYKDADPGGLTTNPVHVDPSLLPRTLGTKQPGSNPNPFIWAVGHQFQPYSGSLPASGSGGAAATVTTSAPSGTYPNFDYSTSLVRDPAYPVGEPRLACGLGDAASPVVAEGFFEAVVAGGGVTPQMAVDLVTLTARNAVTLPNGQFLEPEAPLSAASVGGSTKNYFASLLTTGDLAVCDDNVLTWTSTGSFSQENVRARRLRSLALAASAVDELELFFIGADPNAANNFLLYGLQLSAGTWSAPKVLGTGLAVHPLAGLAVAARAATSIEAFTISWESGAAGVLTRVWWPVIAPWPPANSEPLEPTSPSSFLPTTALAAVSPDASTVLVFGVGTDLHLHYVEFSDPAGAGTVTAMGTADEYVSPHTMLAAALSATGITVAAFADSGRVRVYEMTNAAGSWTIATTLVPDPPQVPYTAAPNPADQTATANLWRLNPFGDLAIGCQGTNQYLYAAGTNPSYANPRTSVTGERTALLQFQMPNGPWQVYQR